MTNELVLTGSEDKYSHIFAEESLEKERVKLTDDEQFANEKEKDRQTLAEFFDLGEGATFDDFFQTAAETEKDIHEAYAERMKPVKEEELEVVTEKELAEAFEESQHVYRRDAAERKGLTEPSWSQSTDTVVENRVHVEDLTNRSRTHLNSQTSSKMDKWGTAPSDKPISSLFGKTNSSSEFKSSESDKKTTGGKKAIDEFQRMNASVQGIDTGRARGWSKQAESDEEYFAQFASNTPWWKKGIRKVKRFMKSGKGRITGKVGIVLALQMAMAVYSKKIEFENKQQMFAMFSFMLASFFMTKELSEEGLDVRGMIF